MSDLSVLCFTGLLALASASAARADDKPQYFSLKGARLVESHDVFRNGNLAETDFTVGKLTGHAVFDAMGGSTFTAGHCRWVITPAEDKYGYDAGWNLKATDLGGGPCAGVPSGHYGAPK